MTWESSGKSKEAKFFKKIDYLSFCALLFSQNWANFQKPPKMGIFWLCFGHFWRLFSFGWKVGTKPTKVNSLKKFASFDAPLDPQVARLVEWNESGVKKTLCAKWPASPLINPIKERLESLKKVLHSHVTQRNKKLYVFTIQK